MPLQANVKYNDFTILVSDMSDCYVVNIFNDVTNEQLSDVPYSPLGAGVKGAIEDGKRFVDQYRAKTP